MLVLLRDNSHEAEWLAQEYTVVSAQIKFLYVLYCYYLESTKMKISGKFSRLVSYDKVLSTKVYNIQSQVPGILISMIEMSDTTPTHMFEK